MTKALINDIHLGKWETLMSKLDNNSIDLIVTSPPYNVDLGNNKHNKNAYAEYDDNMPYNEYLNWMENLFLECNRVLKHGGRLCVNIGDGSNGSVATHVDFTYRLLHLFDEKWICGRSTCIEPDADNSYEPFEMITTIVWDKHQIGSQTSWGSWMSPSSPSFPTQFEFIIVVGKGSKKKEGDQKLATVTKDDFITNSRALWTFPPETRMASYGHPACFPEELPRRCIDQLSYKGDIVLDMFSGSGTTCAVAKKMGRRYIGFEMTEKYVNTSKERLNWIPETVVTESGEEVPKWMT